MMASCSEGTLSAIRAAVLPALTPPQRCPWRQDVSPSSPTGASSSFSPLKALLTCLKSPSLTEEVSGFVTGEVAQAIGAHHCPTRMAWLPTEPDMLLEGRAAGKPHNNHSVQVVVVMEISHGPEQPPECSDDTA